VITWLSIAVVGLVGGHSPDDPTHAEASHVPVAPGGAMPEHMVPLNPEITEATPTQAEPSPSLPCSRSTQATACVDLANGLVWVKDLPRHANRSRREVPGADLGPLRDSAHRRIRLSWPSATTLGRVALGQLQV